MTFPTLKEIKIITARSGASALKVYLNDGTERLIHSLYDPEAEAKKSVDSFQFGGEGLIVVLGLGLGYHVREIVAKYPKAEIVVIEPYQEIYEIAKTYGTLKDLRERATFLVGRFSEEAIQEISKKQFKNGIKAVSVFRIFSEVSAFPDFYKPISNLLEKTVSLKIWEKLKYPKFRSADLTIAILDSGYFLNVEIEKALRELGHRTVSIEVKKESLADSFITVLIEKIIQHRPDFVLAVNHIGFDEEGVLSDFFKSIEMPVSSWYVDSPRIIVGSFEKNVSSNVSLFLWDKSYIKEMKAMGFEHVSYLPLGTDTNTFKPLNLTKKELKKFSSDIGFVGDSMTDAVKKSVAKVRGSLRQLTEEIAHLFYMDGKKLDDILQETNTEELLKGISR